MSGPKKSGRSGRFRSCLTQEEDYLLACQRYIELNPVRGGMVEHPAEYRWSSYRANAQGEADPLLKPHRLYEALGLDSASRQAAYRELFRYELEPELVDKSGAQPMAIMRWVMNAVATEIAEALGRRTVPGKSGRPRRMREPETKDLFN